ncbi:MAG: nickel-dependent lactate racemase [Planctomycetota bacterium]
MRVAFPYGSSELGIEIPEEKLAGVYVPRELPGTSDLRGEIKRALSQPAGTAQLAELARGKRSAAVVVDDATRSVPSRELLGPVMKELEAGGLDAGGVVVIVATGLHRPLGDGELEAVRGDLPVRVINHNARDEEGLVAVGRTFLGQEIRVNRTFLEAELKVLTGDVEYHQFCGYGGGAKSVYPGLADADSIAHNHSMMEVKGAGPGRIEGNPVRQEIEEVGRLAGVDFALNVVMNSKKEVVRAYAGEASGVVVRAARLVDEMYRVPVEKAVDLVIASPGGYPRDIELYQSQKAISAGRRIVRKGGTIAVLAECREGHGSALFDKWMTEAEEIEEIFSRIRERFVMGGHKAYQFAREIAWAKVCLLSSLASEKVEDYFMHPLAGVEEIEQLVAEADSVAALPYATMTLAEIPGGNG